MHRQIHVRVCMRIRVCVSLPQLQPILQQVHVGRLRHVSAQLDDGQQEGVQVPALRPEALRGTNRTHKHTQHRMKSQHKALRKR